MSTPDQTLIDDKLLSVEQVAKRFGVSDKTVRRWIHDKQLRCVLLGRTKRLRIPQSELDLFIHAKE